MLNSPDSRTEQPSDCGRRRMTGRKDFVLWYLQQFGGKRLRRDVYDVKDLFCILRFDTMPFYPWTERLELIPDKVWLLITVGGGPKSDTDDVF